MKTSVDRAPLFHALLDGTLDAEGEDRVMTLLANDAAARREFTELVDLHVMLSGRATAVRPESGAGTRRGSNLRRMAGLSVYWLSAAAAVVVAANAAVSAPPVLGSPDFTGEVAPALAAHCGRCHGDTAALARAGGDALWDRVTSSHSSCGSSLDDGARALLRRWLMFGFVRA